MWFVVRVLAVVTLLPLAAAGDPITIGPGEPLPVLGDPFDRFEPRGYDLDHYDLRLFAVYLEPELLAASSPDLVDPLHTPWGLVGLPLPEGVLLKWNQPAAGAPDGYRVYRAVDDGAPEVVAETTGPLHLDEHAWDADATVLAYTVTAVYTTGSVQTESAHSNVFIMPGPLGDCRFVWVYGQEDPNAPLPLDFGVDPSYLDCVKSGGTRAQDGQG